MQHTFKTDRLTLDPLTLGDAAFILELVNLPDWLRFIGDRNVHSIADAEGYISKLLANSNIQYWVVRLLENQAVVGAITFIKRDYLEHHDIGFAFLPDYAKHGYAYEAAKVVLDLALQSPDHTRIAATTNKDNVKSIRLLEKLGLQFEKQIVVDESELQLYTIAAGKAKP